MVKRLGKDPEGFLSHPRHDAARSSRRFWSGGRLSRSSARRSIRNSWPANATDLHGLGDSHPQRQRLESAVLPDDRRPLSGYQEMLEKVDWDKYGVVDGVARDPRCENCMVHCGYDPSGALGTNYQRGDNWKNFRYNFWPQTQAACADGRQVNALQRLLHRQRPPAEAKAAISRRYPAQESRLCSAHGNDLPRPAAASCDGTNRRTGTKPGRRIEAAMTARHSPAQSPGSP